MAIVGGSSGMGLGIALAVARRGGSVLMLGRDAAKLEAARKQVMEVAMVDSQPEVIVLDCLDEEALKKHWDSAKAVDHLVVTAGPQARPVSGTQGILTGSWKAVMSDWELKVGMAYKNCQYGIPKINDGGSVLLFSGAHSLRKVNSTFQMSGANSLNELLTKTIAQEVAPRLRCNCVCPGLTRTGAFGESGWGMTEQQQESMYEGFGKTVPAGRVGTPDDIGEAAASILCNNWMTGAVVDVDGGALIKK